MRAALRVLTCLFVLLALAGCAEVKDDGDAEPSATAPSRTTPDDVRSAVWERSYSECASYPLPQLAQKYKVATTVTAVSDAVGRAWTRQFTAGADAVTSGTEGCIQGMNTR